jgi:DNA repair exonuclease SbcCD ATPase subunit
VIGANRLLYHVKGYRMPDGNEPATKSDLTVANRLDRRFESIAVRFDQRFNALELRVEQLLSEMESRILAAVYRLVESRNKRLTETERETAAIKERLATLEERLTDVEKRLDLPPQA